MPCAQERVVVRHRPGPRIPYFRHRCRTIAILAISLSSGAPRGLGQPQSSGAAAGDDGIQALIARLGHSSFDVRTRATKRLIAIGPRARAALKEAAAGDDFEVAVRARELLAVLDALFFAGLTIELDVSKRRIHWDESTDLIVRFTNPTDQSARVPLSLAHRDQPVRSGPARQVADMLDIADYLNVWAPDGQPVELHVDDINEDLRVTAAVDSRLDDGPVSVVAPGARVTFRAAQFNRGWARYRLLQAGTYRLQWVYAPQWDDAELRESGIGQVASNMVELKVVTAAPEAVCQATQPARLSLVCDGEWIAATLINLEDLPIHVNLNISPEAPAQFAELTWYVSCGAERERVAGDLSPPSGVRDFSRRRIAEVAPGAQVELGRIPLADLNEAPILRKAGPLDQCAVFAVYANRACRYWQRTNAAHWPAKPKTPETVREPFPRRMLATRLRSEPMSLATLRGGTDGALQDDPNADR